MRPELQILVHPPFRRLFLARTLSLLGSAMAPVALAFAVLDQTHGAVAKLGIVLFARAAAQLAFLLPGGILADRISRRQQMLAAEVLSGCSQAAMAALFLTHSRNGAIAGCLRRRARLCRGDVPARLGRHLAIGSTA